MENTHEGELTLDCLRNMLELERKRPNKPVPLVLSKEACEKLELAFKKLADELKANGMLYVSDYLEVQP